MADPILTQGVREIRRDLKKLEPAADKEFRKESKGIGDKVAAEARGLETRGTGRYARSLRTYVTLKGIAVGSPLPQAGVLHFGGTIRPRGTAITFPARPVVSTALDRQTDQIVEDLGDAVDAAALKAGWH